MSGTLHVSADWDAEEDKIELVTEETKDISVKDWICQDVNPKRTFAVFNITELTEEPISDADILPFELKSGSREESEAWSAGCFWYFVGTEAGIVLAQPGAATGVICLKRSWRFLEAFLEYKPSKTTKGMID